MKVYAILIMIFIIIFTNNENKPIIICLGSSSTYGTGASEYNDYPSLLNNYLPEYLIINRGKHGLTYDELLKDINDIILIKPKYIILQIGTNDIIHNKSISNLNNLIELLIKNNITVVLINIQNSEILNDYKVREYNNYLKQLSEMYNLILIDRYNLLGRDYFIEDRLHHNDEGYLLLSNNIYESIF